AIRTSGKATLVRRRPSPSGHFRHAVPYVLRVNSRSDTGASYPGPPGAATEMHRVAADWLFSRAFFGIFNRVSQHGALPTWGDGRTAAMIGISFIEIMILLLLGGGTSTNDLVSLLDAEEYLRARDVPTSIDSLKAVAGKVPTDGKSQVAQLLAIRLLGELK